jgi:dTDP-4-dehydrorhamnose 3,5-epimerase
MELYVEDAPLRGVKIVTHQLFEDDRGLFFEVFRADEYQRRGLPTSFEQVNLSRSVRGVLRGLHFQWDPPMGKLMRVTSGTAFLIAVDIRKGSPTLSQWFGLEVSSQDCMQIWAPAGFARGFCVLSESAEIQYMCTGIYNPTGESGIVWNDPAIGIEWPISEPILSAKDAAAQSLQEWLDRPESGAFTYDD